MNAMLESSDKKDIFKHRKKKRKKKVPYMSSMQGSSITHLCKNNELFVMDIVFLSLNTITSKRMR